MRIGLVGLDAECWMLVIKRKSETKKKEEKKSSLFTDRLSCLSSSEHTSQFHDETFSRHEATPGHAMGHEYTHIGSYHSSGDSKKHTNSNLFSSDYAATCLTRPLIMLFSILGRAIGRFEV